MPKRIQRKRTKGWKMPENCVCVTRPTIFGNPWIGPDAVEAYRRFIGQITNHHLSLFNVELGLNVECTFQKPIDKWQLLHCLTVGFDRCLDGKDLACFCDLSKPCHADVLLELANKEDAK